MKNQIILFTHSIIGQALLESATFTLGTPPSNVKSISVQSEDSFEKSEAALVKFIQAHSNESILILTDLYGSSPCNIASKYLNQHSVKMISGVNLGMLLKAINYRHLPLPEWADCVYEGGKTCIKLCI